MKFSNYFKTIYIKQFTMIEDILPIELFYKILEYENFYQNEHKIKYENVIKTFKRSPKFIFTLNLLIVISIHIKASIIDKFC